MPALPSEKAFLSDINVTSLVDVTMVLLIIFILVTPIMERGLTVNLPESEQPELDVGNAAIVSIDSKGDVYLGTSLVTLEELGEKLTELMRRDPSTSAVIKAEGALPYSRVIEVLDVVEMSGITKLGMATQAKER
jgi:biopolymer transport protein ExbD